MSNFAALTRMRIQLTIRNKMFLFFSVIMPFGFFFLYAGVFAKGVPETVRYLLGPVVALTVMGSFWGLSAALVTFREQGILRRFHVTPVTPSDMLASSVVANYFLTLPTVVLELLFARVFFHIHNFGDILAVFILVTVGTVSFASLGLVVASVTNTMQETQIINQLIWTAFLFLSGASVPLAIFPHWIQGAALFMPATYLATGLQAAASGFASSSELVADFVALTIGLLVAFEISRQLFRWEPEQKVPGRAKLWVLVAMIPFLAFGIYENVAGTRLEQVRRNFIQLSNRDIPDRPPSSR